MSENKISRHDFLGMSLAIGSAVALTETLFVGLRFLSPKAVQGQFGGFFNLGSIDQFPAGSVTPVQAGRFYLVRLQDGGLLAVYRRCTHLGCSVTYEPASSQFVCPCHGSEFTMQADVINPPAPRPLDLFALSISDTGEVVVDTSKPIERDRVSPDQIVYV